MSLDTPPPKRRRSIREDHRLLTRQRLQDAALSLFRSNGYTATTVEQISAEAGVARATFYLHFASKLELVVSIAEGSEAYGQLGKSYGDLDELLSSANGQVSAEQLAPWLAVTWDRFRRNASFLTVWQEVLSTEREAADSLLPRIDQIPQYLLLWPEELRQRAWLRVVLLYEMTRHTFVLAHGRRVLESEDAELLSILGGLWADGLRVPKRDGKGGALRQARSRRQTSADAARVQSKIAD